MLNICVDGESHFLRSESYWKKLCGEKTELEKLGYEIEIYAPFLGEYQDDAQTFRLAGFVYIPQPEYTFVLPWGKGFYLSKLKPSGVKLIHSHAYRNHLNIHKGPAEKRNLANDSELYKGKRKVIKRMLPNGLD